MNINPGELNKRISIVDPEKTRDNDGYYTEADSIVHECWAKFSRQSGREVFKAGADFAEVDARFLIRYTRKNVHRKLVVLYRGNRYEIVYVNDYGDSKEYIEIWAKLKTQEKAI